MTKNNIGETFKQLCKTLGYSKQLVQHYLQHKPHILDDLNTAAELIASLDMPLDKLDLALDDWKVSSWKGRKGERVGAIEFAEATALYWETWRRDQQTLDALNKPKTWYEIQLSEGKTIKQIDSVIWLAEQARDKRWGSYCV